MNTNRTTSRRIRQPKLDVTNFTHTGHVREQNEDAVLVNARARLFAVADGIGGERSGEVASRLAIRVLQREFPDLLKTREPESALSLALHTANIVVNLKSQRPKHRGMGTTLTAAHIGPRMIDGYKITIGHVGDSRAYLLMRSPVSVHLHQLTTDDVCGPETAYPGALSYAIGCYPDTRVSICSAIAQPDDMLLLCTDGLYNELEPTRIAELLTSENPVERLLKAALATGARDNVSGIVVKF